jgi:hypothetical protein
MTHTLFVLGAGASVPYGYPTGRDLRSELVDLEFLGGHQHANWPGTSGDQITRRRQHIEAHFQWIKNAGRDFTRHAKMARELKHSGCTSIDAFVATRSEFVDEAKFSIAAILLARENWNALFAPETQGNWYEHLWNLICSTATRVSDIRFEKVRIFTFNYDRSLEAYLLRAIQSRFNISEVDAGAALEKLSIEHAYGSLGKIVPYANEGIRYGEWDGDFAGCISKAATTLRLMPETRIASEQDPFEAAKKWLAEANRVYYLGYGFDKLNDERLGFGETAINLKQQSHWASNPDVYATTMGLTQTESTIAGNRLGTNLFHFSAHWDDCLSCLHHYPPLL